MAFFRIYPSHDTSIANGDPAMVGTKDITGSNVGASEILNLYRTVTEQSSEARILIRFDLSEIPSGALLTGANYQLHMFDAQHAETVPTEFTVYIYQASSSWTEGQGHDMDYYTDLGYANWVSASVSAAWSASGGDSRATFDPTFGYPLPYPLYNSLTSSFYFQTGHEDLDVDVFRAVVDWLTVGNNFGFYIQIDPSLTGTDYYTKKFHSRQSHFPDKRPYLEIRWTDFTGVLSTSSYWMATSGAWSGSYLDSRLSGTIPGMSVSVSNSLVDPTGALLFNLYNLKSVYDRSEVTRLLLYARPKDWDPSTVTTASSGLSGTVLTNAYYRVVNAVTEEVVVPFASGVIPYTKLSYDDSGNYFDFYMPSMPTGTLLRFDFCYKIGNRTTFVPGDEFTFRVR
jgi:hypothetical protein